MTTDSADRDIHRGQLAHDPMLLEVAPELARCVSPAHRNLAHDDAHRLRWLWTRVRDFTVAHRQAAAWLLPLVTLAAGIHGWNMLHAPGPNDDEGTYVSQAWALQEHRQLSHYTYWYDHPPLGWMLLGLWNALRLDIPRGADLWSSGRQAMLVIHLLSCLLLFVLARRLVLPRWAAAVAVLAFTVSPLGMAWQRLTLLDNIATPLLIGAWLLVLSPRRRLAAYTGGGLLLACAVLVKETNALFLPAIAVQLWVAARGPTRRFALTLFAGVFTGVLLLYPLYATLKDELLPGPGHVSLLWALQWQLLSRPSSGSLLDPGSGTHLAIADWLHRDGLLLGAAATSVPLVAWRHQVARPLAGVLTLLLAMPLRGGYLPAPYPVNLIWPCALLTAAGTYLAVRPLLAQPMRSVRIVTASLLTVLLTYSGGRALAADRTYLTDDGTQEYRQALSWLLSHTTRNDVMLVDNTLWIELVQRGYPTRNVIWYYKFDLDPAVRRQHPDGWRAVDYVIESSIIGATDSSLPETANAIAHGRQVAAFGDIHVYQLARAAPPRPG